MKLTILILTFSLAVFSYVVAEEGSGFDFADPYEEENFLSDGSGEDYDSSGLEDDSFLSAKYVDSEGSGFTPEYDEGSGSTMNEEEFTEDLFEEFMTNAFKLPLSLL